MCAHSYKHHRKLIISSFSCPSVDCFCLVMLLRAQASTRLALRSLSRPVSPTGSPTGFTTIPYTALPLCLKPVNEKSISVFPVNVLPGCAFRPANADRSTTSSSMVFPRCLCVPVIGFWYTTNRQSHEHACSPCHITSYHDIYPSKRLIGDRDFDGLQGTQLQILPFPHIFLPHTEHVLTLEQYLGDSRITRDVDMSNTHPRAAPINPRPTRRLRTSVMAISVIHLRVW
jgi:hypothetical protein